MKTYTGQQHVPAGLYYNTDKWELVSVSGRRGGTLEGNPTEDTYLRMNPVMGLLMAPMMGALMVCFLPFIGFVLLAEHAGRAVAKVVKNGTEDVASTLIPEVRHGEAHLTGQKKKVMEKQEETSKK